ncbi:hypothetical protein tinsulaeT_00430 [Thalassotalea insulae]|uniref:DUF2147 domain-containing protein n=1 Tax=Thalassotalea insulae TaxID=2056778 RepID=A0ABQ6GL11_9GAMM|nr:hypothetical protein [Thalassotalea insulae]GLX76703.1 hypothetical protein tinsulaeT_00430 [Thalassotalea insulae]
MRNYLVILFIFSFNAFAADLKELQGIYEGIELNRNDEIKGISYFYIDLLKPEGEFVYKDNLSSTEKGLECKIDSANILWSNPVARIPMHCEGVAYKYELIFVLDASMLKGSTYSLNSDALVTLLLKGNDVSSEMASMWVVRTEKKLLLEQLENAVPYKK